MSKRIKSTAKLAQLDFSRVDEKQLEKDLGPSRMKKLLDYFSYNDIKPPLAQSKREKRKQKNLELKSRMS